jgi:hypothetical protein
MSEAFIQVIMLLSNIYAVLLEITKYTRFRKFGGRGHIFFSYSQTDHAVSVYFIPINRTVTSKNFDV